MQIEILPSTARGSVVAPPSKSMAHRLLICAGLCNGLSRISGIAPSQDVLATLDCLSAIGATYRYEGNTVEMQGIDPSRVSVKETLACRECGSTLRFFIPIALLCEKEVTLTGSTRLMERPLGVYDEMCRAHGLPFRQKNGCVTVKGKLQSGIYELAGDVSSQFISGLLFVLPLLEGDSEIRLTGKVESRSYIDLTVRALALFGVSVEWKNDRTIAIAGGQRYCSKITEVEGDYSNSAFFEAINKIGGAIVVDGLSKESLQGDRVYASYFEELQKGMPTLSLANCPDLGPVLMAVAAANHGAVFTDTARLKIKESDRGAAMARELAKLGGKVQLEENTIRVLPSALHAPTELLDGHNDHRIVMALSVLLTKLGGRIDGAEAVAKSMPDFFERLQDLGVKIKRYDTE